MSNAGVIRFPKIHNFLSFFENDTVLFVFFFSYFRCTKSYWKRSFVSHPSETQHALQSQTGNTLFYSGNLSVSQWYWKW